MYVALFIARSVRRTLDMSKEGAAIMEDVKGCGAAGVHTQECAIHRHSARWLAWKEKRQRQGSMNGDVLQR
jgi:hypothetical protein